MNIKQSKGFTLIELLVVIAIIGLLSSVVLASLSTARAKARDARRMADVKNIKLALELYFDASSSYPVPPSALVAAEAGWIPSYSTSFGWFKNELKPYLQGEVRDPINSWPLAYYYRTANFTGGLDSSCNTISTTEGETYLLSFASEGQTYNLPIYSKNQFGYVATKERYCIRP